MRQGSWSKDLSAFLHSILPTTRKVTVVDDSRIKNGVKETVRNSNSGEG